jgi:hypothetical protein
MQVAHMAPSPNADGGAVGIEKGSVFLGRIHRKAVLRANLADNWPQLDILAFGVAIAGTNLA